jgi:CheY-like chemotaxis protein
VSTKSSRIWQIVHVEDNHETLQQVKDYLEGETFGFGSLIVKGTAEFLEATRLLHERKVDLLVLDVFRGDPFSGDSAGTGILEEWRATGFAPVILYTALPEVVGECASPFVYVVAKEAGGLQRLRDAIEQLFALRIPQIHRAAVDHLDTALGKYMWGFVESHWDQIRDLTEQPDFIRLLFRRLGLQFTQGIAPLIRSIYPDTDVADPEPDKVHPVEFYVRPPIGDDPRLGDLRRVAIAGGADSLAVIVWPSCDLVYRDGRCKVDRALCARVKPVTEFEEYEKWVQNPTNKARDSLLSLMKNNRGKGQAERYHFLPGAWDIPSAVVDFGELDHVSVEALKEAPCIATVASPFAESMAARLVRYIGRLGAPDLDIEIALGSLKSGVDSE